MTLKIGVPSKGRLMDKTFAWFGARGLTMRQSGSDREYSGTIEGIEGAELVRLSASEIPRELSTGRIHLGVTGSDLIRDKLADWDMQVAELAALPSAPRMAKGCALPPNITGWCAIFWPARALPITSWLTALGPPRAR
jgi:ATP phosphoribosyltransferase